MSHLASAPLDVSLIFVSTGLLPWKYADAREHGHPSTPHGWLCFLCFLSRKCQMSQGHGHTGSFWKELWVYQEVQKDNQCPQGLDIPCMETGQTECGTTTVSEIGTAHFTQNVSIIMYSAWWSVLKEAESSSVFPPVLFIPETLNRSAKIFY